MSTNLPKLFLTLADLVSYLIETDGISKTEFSEKIGADKSQVTKWTNGKLTPGRESLSKIESAYGFRIAKTGDKWTFIDPKLGLRAVLPEPIPISYIKQAQTEDEIVEYEVKEDYTSESRQEKSSQRIQKARERAGYSHEDLAEKLGVHRTTIGKWESNKAQPSIENYEKMSEILKVSPIWLMSIDQYTSQIPNEHALSRRNITDLRTRLAQIQAHAGLPEHDFEILHAAIGLLGRILRNIEE